VNGKLIVFEGINGCGKTSLRNEVYKHFIDNYSQHKYTVTTTAEPWFPNKGYGSELNTAWKDLFEDPHFRRLPKEAQAMVFCANRVAHTEHIKWCQKSYDFILCSRWIESTMVYQGWNGTFFNPFVMQLADRVQALIKQAHTFILNVPPEVAYKRLRERGEEPDLSTLATLSNGYKAICERVTDHSKYTILDATQPLDVLTKQVVEKLITLDK
jgi:dTMP kinase